MTATKKMILAISTEAPAMPPKPKMPAINATIKNVTTQLNMVLIPVSTFRFESRRDRQDSARDLKAVELIQPGSESSAAFKRQNRQKSRHLAGTKSAGGSGKRRRDNSCQIASRTPIWLS